MSTKLLIISDAWHPQINGVVRTYEHLAQELAKQDFEIEVIGPSDLPLSISLPFYKEIKIALFPYKKIKNKFQAILPDKVHIATEGSLGWAARRYCIKHNIPFTTSYHTHFPDYVAKRVGHYIPGLYNITHDLAVKYICKFHRPAHRIMVSTQSVKVLLQDWGLTNDIELVSRGVDYSIFYPGERTLFNNLPEPIALYVGRIAIEKNIEAFLDMPWHGSKVVVGDGPMRQALEQKHPEVTFTGKKSGKDLSEIYRSCDLFVFPSKTDTFGIVLIEAMASGLPISAYNVMGPKDIVTQPEIGALDDKSLHSACLRALEQSDRDKSVAHAQQYYSWNHAALQFIKML